jgi:hypothetical protein
MSSQVQLILIQSYPGLMSTRICVPAAVHGPTAGKHCLMLLQYYKNIIIINETTARLGPWPPLRVFVMVRYVRYEVISPMINLILVILIRPPDTSVSKASRHPVAKQVKNG